MGGRGSLRGRLGSILLCGRCGVLKLLERCGLALRPSAKAHENSVFFAAQCVACSTKSAIVSLIAVFAVDCLCLCCLCCLCCSCNKLARHWFPPKTPHAEHATPSGHPRELPGSLPGPSRWALVQRSRSESFDSKCAPAECGPSKYCGRCLIEVGASFACGPSRHSSLPRGGPIRSGCRCDSRPLRGLICNHPYELSPSMITRA